MGRALCVAATLCVALSAVAKPGTVYAVPAEKPGDAPPGLTATILGYEGGTNGVITVEVKNPTKAPIAFAAQGLYFVPQGDPDHSPQRLGAVGSYDVNGKREERLTLAPGATVKAKLDVYCIDSHRPSPTSTTPFALAKDRVPVDITRAIHRDAEDASKGYGGMSAPAAKSAVQQQVWKNRDRKWVPLQGEGAQEATK